MRETEGQSKPVLAIDLGGTKIITAIVSNKGQVIARDQFPTLRDEGPQPIINRIFLAIDRLLEKTRMKLSRLNSISIAAAGAIDVDKGLITLSPNLPGWEDVPLRDVFTRKLGVRTFLVNDADAAFLGETYGRAGFRNRVHGGADNRYIQHDAVGKLGCSIRFLGHHDGLRRDQKQIVKGQGLFNIIIQHSCLRLVCAYISSV